MAIRTAPTVLPLDVTMWRGWVFRTVLPRHVLEGEDYLGGAVPAWAPHNSGTYDRGTLPGTSRLSAATEAASTSVITTPLTVSLIL